MQGKMMSQATESNTSYPWQMSNDIRCIVRYKTEHLEPVSALAAVMGELANLPAQVHDKLQCGLAEILNNIAEHGAIDAPPACTIEVLADTQRLGVSIRDDGRAAPLFFYLYRPDEPDWINVPDASFLPEQGFGRHIIHSCFERIHYHSATAGNTLILEMNFNLSLAS